MTRILVVDDDQTVGQLLQDILRQEGYLVDYAASAVDAFGSMAGDWPDVMLLDLRMPVIDGWTLLRTCRQDLRGAQLRVVLMTAAQEQQRAEELGAAFVAKPFDLDVLLDTIRDALAQPQHRSVSTCAAQVTV
jgi:CheY-like chemotaxis protein